MSKKIVVLCGSPRKRGNTNRVVSWFAETAEESGASVEIVDTTRLQYKALDCTSCFKCQESEKYECTVDDEATPILLRLPLADLIVFATPVYWFAPTAQLKVFSDRMLSLIKLDPGTGDYVHPMKGKAMALIATGGGDLNSGLNCVDLTFRTAAAFMSMDYDALLIPSTGMDASQIENDEALRKKVRAFAGKLAV
jgi:multimeric flavodoxin WrbA